MSGTRLNVSLEGLDIGLSGAVPGRGSWSEPAMDRAILEFVALFSGIACKYGGRIVHGSHPTFTPVILRQARLHADKGGSRKPVTLIMSELWAKDLPKEFADGEASWRGRTGKCRNTQPQPHGNAPIIDRKPECDDAVGGKMHERDGIVPGVREEMDMAAQRGIPRFLIAGMGGYAAQYGRELTPSSLRNGLSDGANALLFSTTDVSACVNVLFEQLAKLKGGAAAAS